MLIFYYNTTGHTLITLLIPDTERLSKITTCSRVPKQDRTGPVRLGSAQQISLSEDSNLTQRRFEPYSSEDSNLVETQSIA